MKSILKELSSIEEYEKNSLSVDHAEVKNMIKILEPIKFPNLKDIYFSNNKI